uniref:Ovule protein n=1 Tax=Heterorhabditis bacteriophora TaxID=37862 RepID=A0A1I7WD83_HETBA
MLCLKVVGYIIHCSFGQQDGRNYSGNGHFPAFIQLQLLVTLFCLCGLIFLVKRFYFGTNIFCFSIFNFWL